MPESGAVLRAGQEAVLARLGCPVPEGLHEGPLRLGQDLAGLEECCRVVGKRNQCNRKYHKMIRRTNFCMKTNNALAEMKRRIWKCVDVPWNKIMSLFRLLCALHTHLPTKLGTDETRIIV